MPEFAFQCRLMASSCEWAVQGRSVGEVMERVRDHERCAHQLADLDPETVRRIEAAIRPLA